MKKLEYKKISKGERWVYSAAFDITDLSTTKRVDDELDDIKQILSSGGIVSILSHQGRYEDKNTIHLDFVADYLSKILKKQVRYFPENNTESSVEFSKSLKPGQGAIFGNTRFNEGETKNHKELAKQFSRFGDFVAIGGMSKAHRKNSSNVGLLDYLPGFITRCLIRNMSFLEPWVGEKDGYSVVILGGRKKEKITTGLGGFSEIYDVIIPGGIVLNTILKARGYEIGDSIIDEYGKTFEKEAEEILNNAKKKAEIYLPLKAVIAKKTETGYANPCVIDLREGVPKNYMIVSYLLSPPAVNSLERAVNEKGRIILAGTPDLYKEGFGLATNEVIERIKRLAENSLILGGDTGKEIKYDEEKYHLKVSTGGGSSLEYIIKGTVAVFEALKTNYKKFKRFIK